MDKLTRDLHASISYEQSKRLQPFNPMLSEFSEDQLRAVLYCLSKDQMELRRHMNGLKQTESLASMMQDKIFEHEVGIEIRRELIVQFMGALANKEKERCSQES